jgi:hypothetical protein
VIPTHANVAPIPADMNPAFSILSSAEKNTTRIAAKIKNPTPAKKLLPLSD